MSVEVRIVEEKFFAELNNGSTFAANLTDFATHLKGGVLEKLKASFKVQVLWTTEMDTFWINYDGAGGLIINDNTADFVSDGFTVGDSVKLSVNAVVTGGGDSQLRGDITSITGGNVTLDSVLVPIGSVPTGVIQAQNETAYLTGLTDLTALNYKFGLIENNDSFNTLSKLTNTDQSYFANAINHGVPGTFATGVSFGNNKAWVTGNMEVAFSQLVNDEDLLINQATTQEFDIHHEFVINPIFRDGEEDSLDGTDIPPLDIFNGSKSLKYAFEAEFRTVVNNPNTSKTGIFDTSTGSVGYLNESFNGFANDYTITDVVYTDVFTAATIDEIDVTTTTRVNFTINGTGLMAAGIPIVVGHTAILDSLAYLSSTDDYNTLWFNETLRNTEGAALVNGAIIKGLTATASTVDTLDVQFSIVFNVNQQWNFTQGQKYLLYATIQDNSASVNVGNKVTLRIDQGEYEKNTDVSGLLTANTFHQYPHPETYTQGVTTGYVQGKMFIEDGQMAYADLRLATSYLAGTPEFPVLQINESVYLRSLKFKIVAFDTVNETWFDLRELDVDLGSNVLTQIGGVDISNFNLDSTRGYILENSDIFNYLKFKTGTNFGTTIQYHLEVGYKIPWQEWLALVGADTVFYDAAQPNNGLNNDASNYSFLHNYKLRFLVDAEIETNNVISNYVISSGNFEAYDYRTDDQSPDEFSCIIQTYDIDSNALANNIIDQDYTRIEVRFTPFAAIIEPNPYYGIVRLEPLNATSDASISEISTIIEAPTNSLLKQLSGASRLATMSVDSGDYVLECLVDTSLTSAGTSYKISALLRDKTLDS